jgi:hypothetical protein
MPHDHSSDTITALNDRLLRLERSNRRLAWLAAAGAAAVMLIVAGGAMPDPVPEKIEAKEFVLRSRSGKVIAELGENPVVDDEPYFYLFDKDRRVRFSANIHGIGISKRLPDATVTATDRILLRRSEDGECSLLFRDDQGRSRLQVGLTKEQVPTLTIWDKNLVPLINLTVDEKTDAPLITINEVKP